MSFRVVERSTVATGGFLELTALKVEGPDGRLLDRYVVRHPGAVVVVPVEDDDEHVLLVRQYRAAVDAELLEVPAGKRDVDGEAPEVTARRELEEEVGRRARSIEPLAGFYNTPGFCDEYTYLFLARGLEPLPARRTQTAEEHAMEVVRVALGDVEHLIATRQIVDAKTIIGLLLTRRLLESRSG